MYNLESGKREKYQKPGNAQKMLGATDQDPKKHILQNIRKDDK